MSVKQENGRQIKAARLQVVEFKAPVNFLRQTEEAIFARWLFREQEELYLADQYEVKRLDIEKAIRREARRRYVQPLPPAGRPSEGRMKETAIRCEKPQGVEQQLGQAARVNSTRVVTMWRAPESGTEYMKVSGENGDDWFRIRKAA